jgi:hypothetical protein
MNKALVILALFISFQVLAQDEFEVYKNGLIYSENTMNKLGRIVDSLNLKYKTCDLNKVLYSKSQAIAHIVRLESGNIKQAKTDMDNKMPFEDFIRIYPNAKIEMSVLVVKYKYENYEKEEIVEFGEVNFNTDYGLEIRLNNKKDLYHKNVAQSWVYNYKEESKYSKESLSAFYFPENFKSAPINLNYSRLIGYSDCLIDTNSTKIIENAKSGWVELPKKWQSLSQKEKEKLLAKMRATEVMGMCSQDSRPREHAANIALLSAETNNWEVFLKSHLDIMNDRFDRISDGSYAYARRKTYIKELEALNIDVVNLLIGISLRTENPAVNHYYGSIGRLGRAISESKNKLDFETQLLKMIEDNELDDYNRVLAYFIFINYNSYLEKKEDQKSNIEKIKRSIEKMPSYIKEKIKV